MKNGPDKTVNQQGSFQSRWATRDQWACETNCGGSVPCNPAKWELCFPNLPLPCSSRLAWPTRDILSVRAGRRRWSSSYGAFAFEKSVQVARGHCSTHGYHLSADHPAAETQQMGLSNTAGTSPLPSLTPGQVLA